MTDATNHPIAKVIDAFAVSSIIGTFMGWLPTFATILSVVWFGIQIFESKTFKKFYKWLPAAWGRRENRWLSATILGIVVLLIIFGHVVFAYAHDHEHPELDNWFMGLQSKAKSPCCSGTDAMRLDDVDWESRDGHYRVRLEGEWVDVPDSAVVDGPNRAGPTMVWPYRQNGKLDHVRCFMPGSMT